MLLPCVAVDFVRVSDAQAFLRGQLFESLHATLPIVSYMKTKTSFLYLNQQFWLFCFVYLQAGLVLFHKLTLCIF